MEKLQKALEKARTARGDRSTIDYGSKSRLPRGNGGGSDAWAALKPLAVDRRQLISNRIIAFEPSPDARYFDILRTRIRDEARRSGYRRIAIASAGPNAGKTTTLANLAFSFARLSAERTMVLDFDLRRPRLHSLLGQEPTTDMGAVLTGTSAHEEALYRYGDNLIFGLNRGTVQHSSELLQSNEAGQLLDQFDATYQPDLMLFDMPPFLAADDAHGFVRNVDAAIIVVEAEVTPTTQIDFMETKLSELTHVLGIVLNKCNYPDTNDAGGYTHY